MSVHGAPTPPPPQEVERLLVAQGLVAVHDDVDPEAAAMALQACYDGGLRAFEFTHRSDRALEVFGHLRSYATARLPGLLLGIGTVFDGATARTFVEAGADFVVSPVAAEEAGAWCRERGVAFVPGAATPTELWRARAMGAGLVKLFPAADLGPGFVKQLLGPLRGSRLMVTGGIAATADEVSRWVTAGAQVVGLGSSLVPRGRQTAERLAQLSASCAELLAAVAKARQRA